MIIALILFYLLFPALIIYLSMKFPVINKIGIVVFCYVGGLIVGVMHIIPEDYKPFQEYLQGGVILLGIPLVLFSENIIKWMKMAKSTFLSLILGVVSILITVVFGFLLLRGNLDPLLTEQAQTTYEMSVDASNIQHVENTIEAEADSTWKVAGLLVGVYTGAQANLASIQIALQVSEKVYMQVVLTDITLGALLLIFLLTIAKWFFGLFMKPYQSKNKKIKPEAEIDVSEFESYEGILSMKNIGELLKGLGVGILVLGAGFSMIVIIQDTNTASLAAVLTVTTLGLALSLIPKVNRIRNSFQLGMYFIYMFCVILASQTDITEIFNPEGWAILKYIFLYVAIAMYGSLIVHALLSWIFKVNRDEFLMTTTALSNSPPFVPVMAAVLKNKEVMIPGMIIGVIGYALGNYLGPVVALLLSKIP